MKFLIQSPDRQGHIDPPVLSLLKDFPGRVHSIHEADVVLVPITKFDGFVFDHEEMSRIDKSIVIVCFCEYGWDFHPENTHVWGKNTAEFPQFNTHPEYMRFDEFVRSSYRVVAQFKRELLAKDQTRLLQPADYRCKYPVQDPVSKSEFSARPIDTFFSWGRSSERRMRLHGAFFSEAQHHGYEVISEFGHLHVADGKQRTVASIHSPHYARIPMETLLAHQARAKISVSLGGAGAKCFRHSEAPANAVMATEDAGLAWAFPWTNENSLVLPVSMGEDEWVGIFDMLTRAECVNSMYDRYRLGLENCKRYMPLHYWNHHMKPCLEAVL